MHILTESKKIQLSEGWGVSPDNLSPAGKIEGTTLYSSDELKDEVLKILFKESNTFNPVQKKLVELFRRDIIVPCFASSSFVKFMLSKFMANQTIDDICGMYDSRENKVYLFLDNNVSSFLNKVDIDKLNTVLIHELMHYSAFNKPGPFLNTSLKHMITYYSAVFDEIGFEDVPNHIIGKYIKWTFTKFEKSKKVKNDALNKYEEFLHKTFTPYWYNGDVAEMEQTIYNLVKSIYDYLTNYRQFTNDVSRDTPSRHLVSVLYHSYKKLGISNPETFPIQEMIYPSEIMCIRSQEKQDATAWKIIKGL